MNIITKRLSIFIGPNENNRLILINTLGAYLVKGGSLLVTLLYVQYSNRTDISTNLISLAIVNVLAANSQLPINDMCVFIKELRGYWPSLSFSEIK